MNDGTELPSYEQAVPGCAIGPGREVSCNRDVANEDIRRWTNSQNFALLSGQVPLSIQTILTSWYSDQLQIANGQGALIVDSGIQFSSRYRVPTARGVAEEPDCVVIR